MAGGEGAAGAGEDEASIPAPALEGAGEGEGGACRTGLTLTSLLLGEEAGGAPATPGSVALVNCCGLGATEVRW